MPASAGIAGCCQAGLSACTSRSGSHRSSGWVATPTGEERHSWAGAGGRSCAGRQASTIGREMSPLSKAGASAGTAAASSVTCSPVEDTGSDDVIVTLLSRTARWRQTGPCLFQGSAGGREGEGPVRVGRVSTGACHRRSPSFGRASRPSRPIARLSQRHMMLATRPP